MNALFWLAHVAVLAGWLLLLVRRSAGVTGARSIAIGLCAAYLGLFLAFAHDVKALAADYSPRGIAVALSDPSVALVGWIHYLAFDLWVGAWEAEQGDAMPRWALSSALIATFLVGPVGLLVFMVLRRGGPARQV